jgi:tetratricopeptide (TPR) repeat protein
MVPPRWKWWTKDGKPHELTAQAVQVLESVLRRDPLHPGANHFYIHAVEQSPNPERAVPSAERLTALPPATGHLIHMAGHIYLQTGDFDLASRANHHAVEMDRGYIQHTGVTTGAYVLGYHPHNTHFIVVAEMARGRFDDAWRAVQHLVKQATPAIQEMPEMADFFLPNEMFVLARFQKWPEILKQPEPHARLPITRAFWRYARTLALHRTGRASDAAAERQAFEQARRAVPAEMMFTVNRAQDVLGVAAAVLDARLASSPETALAHWRRAVQTQDALAYDEPSPWYYPVRESLGGALLRSNRAAQAEGVFREALRRHPRQGRLLFGLMESLRSQKKTTEEHWVRREFEKAWEEAQVRLRIEDL